MIEKVFILQGISGSGKSTWTKNNTPLDPRTGLSTTIVVSADKIFYKPDGTYEWDDSRLLEAHRACLREFLAALTYDERNEPSPLTAKIAMVSKIIVDNTNTRALFMAPYVDTARALDAEVEIVSFRAPVEVCAKRNGGRAPLNIMREQAEAIEHFAMPTHWVRSGVKLTIINTNAT